MRHMVTMNTKQLLNDCVTASGDRYDFWINFINTLGVRNFAEIGIFRGDFAERMLRSAKCLEKYYMIDPWRNLDSWDKPANANNETIQKPKGAKSFSC